MFKRVWNAGTRRGKRALLRMADAGYRTAGKDAWNFPTPDSMKCFLDSLGIHEFLQESERVGVRLLDGTEFWGPEDPVKWLCGRKKTAQVQSVLPRYLNQATPQPEEAHLALLFNLVNRVVTEFSAYPFLPRRTHHLRAGDVFWDIGAFRGYVSVKAAHRVGPMGGVVAVEPMPENLEWIQLHQQRNQLSQLLVLQDAMTGGQEGEQVEFFAGRNQQNAANQTHLETETEKVSMPNRTFSGLLDVTKERFGAVPRVIASVTTNGTEMEIARDMLSSFPSSGLDYLEITLPVIYTADQVPAFLDSLPISNSQSQLYYPWLSLTISR